MTQDIHSGPGDLAPGEQLAGYQIQEQIGRGGMAVVYRALDLRLGRHVALKVLAPHLGEDEAFRQRFIRESRAAAGVDHPHIIPIFEAGEAGGMLFIAMRYVGHGDVRSLIDAEGSLSPARASGIASQVASALDAAHARGLVHRDVKPANMLLGQASGGDSDHVYLSDFGLSKHSLTPSTLTSTGQFLGTLDYVSPEQIQGQPVDGRADQYALACTVVEMLTGAPPFSRDDSVALMWAQLEAEPPRLTERRPDLPPAVDQVVAAALTKAPAGRFPTCRDFAMALSAACEQAIPPRSGPATAAADRIVAEPMPEQHAPAPWPGPVSWPDPASVDWRRSSDPDPVPDAEQTVGPGWRDMAAASSDGRVPQQITPIRYSAQDPAASPASARPATEQGGFGNTPPARRNVMMPGTGQTWPGQSPPLRGRRGKHRGRAFALAALITIVGLGGIAGIVYKLSHRQDTTLPPVTVYTTVPATGGQDPARTVRTYFAAINHHRYVAAWRLSGETEPFKSFVAGFAGTRHDAVSIVSTSGNVVTAKLIATQTDGTVKTYQGTYTITNGVISAKNVRQVG